MAKEDHQVVAASLPQVYLVSTLIRETVHLPDQPQLRTTPVVAAQSVNSAIPRALPDFPEADQIWATTGRQVSEQTASRRIMVHSRWEISASSRRYNPAAGRPTTRPAKVPFTVPKAAKLLARDRHAARRCSLVWEAAIRDRVVGLSRRRRWPKVVQDSNRVRVDLGLDRLGRDLGQGENRQNQRIPWVLDRRHLRKWVLPHRSKRANV
jgi:hypothetical protein